MNILDAIVEHKRIEVLKRKQQRPLQNLAEFPFYERKGLEIDPEYLKDKPGVIGEFKRKSPSKGVINKVAGPLEVAAGYREAGVAAMSILTDRNFFGGSFRDLSGVREAHPELPLLRKDFIIDPYQLHEAKAYGADLVLLIAAILDTSRVNELAAEARTLGLHVLFEVHGERELEKYDPAIRFVGVNNRDLKNFRVDTSLSLDLIRHLPSGVVPVSESGLGDASDVRKLHRAGYKLFLMGEAFMKEADPGQACRSFLEQIAQDE
jgi:indole-3-glycerol phosphate synthase